MNNSVDSLSDDFDDDFLDEDEEHLFGSGRNVRKGIAREALSRLPATHLIRHFLLLATFLLFLLTLTRAGYNLWQLHRFDDTSTLLSSFIQGLRFDLALVGMLLALPVFIVPLLSMFNITRAIAKWFSVLWLTAALIFVLFLELITPYAVQTAGVRPDMAVLAEMGSPVDVLAQLWSKYIIPAVIGLVLAIMILMAFWSRLEVPRFLRHPVKMVPAICLSVIGLLLCVWAMSSSLNPLQGWLSPQSAPLISADTTVNELMMNSGFKTLYSLNK